MDMADSTVSIGVRLELENLKDIVSKAQEALSGLKIGSGAYKDVQRYINSITGTIDKIGARTSNPFTKLFDFHATEKDLNSIEQKVRMMGQRLGRLDFKDLKLSTDEQAQFDAYTNKIKEIQKEIENLKRTTRDGLFTDPKFVKTMEGNPSAGRMSLENLDKELSNRYKKQQQELLSLEQTYAKQVNQGDNLKKYQNIQIGKGLLGDLSEKKWRDILPQDIFEQYFNKNNTFKGGDSQSFLERLRSAGIIPTDEELNTLKKLGNSQILPDVIAQIFNGKVNYQSFQNANNNPLGVLKDVISGKKQQIEETKYASGVVGGAISGVENQTALKKDEIDTITKSMQEWVALLVNNRNVLENPFGEGSNNIALFESQLRTLHTTLETTTSQFLQLQATTNTFNSLKSMVTNFLGLNQVIRLVKQSFQSIKKTIKELDDVMTSISVVTDFSQSDLWEQMDTYASIAQEYAVSIKGVYEVSQIYY